MPNLGRTEIGITSSRSPSRLAGFWIFFCTACAWTDAWARGGHGDGSAGPLIGAFVIFIVLYLLGSTVGNMSPGKTVASGFIVLVAAALFGAIAETILGSPAGTLTAIAILAWVAWKPVSDLLSAWKKNKLRATQETQSKAPQKIVSHSAPAKENLPDPAPKLQTPNDDEFERERVLQEQRRADADQRARALEIRKADSQRKRNDAEVLHEAPVIRDEAGITELEQLPLDEIAGQQMIQNPQDWYDIPEEEGPQHSPKSLHERTRVPQEPSNNNEDLRVASGRSTPEAWPLLRADHWRTKGAILVCLATGENFSPTRYTVENGFYFIDQKPHKGRLAVRDVKALPGQRR